jgi:hypothetical protein
MTRVNLGLLMCSACGSHGDDAAPELADAPADDAVELGPEFSDDDAADQPARRRHASSSSARLPVMGFSRQASSCGDGVSGA